jgi:amino acid transporter
MYSGIAKYVKKLNPFLFLAPLVFIIYSSFIIRAHKVEIQAVYIFFRRLFYVAGRKKHLPPILSMVSISHNTPAPAIMLNGLLSCLMLINDDVYSIINMTNCIYFITIILALAGLVKMKTRNETKDAAIQERESKR